MLDEAVARTIPLLFLTYAGIVLSRKVFRVHPGASMKIKAPSLLSIFFLLFQMHEPGVQ